MALPNGNTPFDVCPPLSVPNDVRPSPSSFGPPVPLQHGTRTGLSITHISTHEEPSGELEWFEGGSLVRVSGHMGTAVEPVYGRRGIIHGFSAASRLRLLLLVLKLNAALFVYVQFLTLTYPGEWDKDPLSWKRNLKAFRQAFERKYGQRAIIWRLEFQTRGAPHFHLLLMDGEPVDRAWLSATWYRIVGSGDLRHLAAGTQVQCLKSWNGVLWYVTKYMSKLGADSQEVSPCGRMWGVWHRERLGIVRQVRVLTEGQFYRVRRFLASARRRRGVKTTLKGRYRGLWMVAQDSTGSLLARAVSAVSLDSVENISTPE